MIYTLLPYFIFSTQSGGYRRRVTLLKALTHAKATRLRQITRFPLMLASWPGRLRPLSPLR